MSPLSGSPQYAFTAGPGIVRHGWPAAEDFAQLERYPFDCSTLDALSGMISISQVIPPVRLSVRVAGEAVMPAAAGLADRGGLFSPAASDS